MTFSRSSVMSPTLPLVAFSRVIKAYTAMKAQKQHDEVMRQPHSHGYARPGIGSDSLRIARQAHQGQHINAQNASLNGRLAQAAPVCDGQRHHLGS